MVKQIGIYYNTTVVSSARFFTSRLLEKNNHTLLKKEILYQALPLR